MHAPTKSLDVAKENNITLQLWDTSSGSSNQKFIITPAKAKSTCEYISTSAEYGTNGNYLTKLTDQNGDSIELRYNENSDILTDVFYENSRSNSYKYDDGNRLTDITTYDRDKELISLQYERDSSNNLSAIKRNGMEYNFEYDAWGALTTVKVGNVPLVSKSYNTNDGKLTKLLTETVLL